MPKRDPQISPGVRLRRVGIEIVGLSAIALFQELALIRWLPGQVRVLAYFPNLVLLAAFLGLGLGALARERRSWLSAWPWILTAVVAFAVALSGIAFTQEGADGEGLWLLYYDLPKTAPIVSDIRPPIIGLFLLGTLSFVPLGQELGRRLDVFRRESSALWGYSWDLLGSLAGVIGFAVVGFTGIFPVVWFGILLALAAPVVARSPRLGVGYAAAAGALLGTVHLSETGERYSPYYAISTRDAPPSILTNRSLHQYVLPVRRSDTALGERGDVIRREFHLPYRILGRPPGRVLVLGAGTGNDVSVALDEGAERVDVVEIDPVILDLGRELHPNRPYDSARAHPTITDARSFLNETDAEYDLIIFGTLDSQTRLSALSNVRLDSFVYTIDSFRAARERLAPGGGVVVYSLTMSDTIGARIAGMLARTFGAPPAVVSAENGVFDRIYLAGPAFEDSAAPPLPPDLLESALENLELPSDDWPYLYLERRAVSSIYLSLGALLACVAAIGVWIASNDLRTRGPGSREFDGEMFYFGLGFLLLETKFVTEMNLVWGATWITSTVVFGSILATTFAATVLTELRSPPRLLAFAGLALALLVAYAAPTEWFLRTGVVAKLLSSGALVGAPVLFAAICFATSFRARPSPGIAFGWNLLGAVAGGLLEFLSMAIGLKAIYLVALSSYLAAFALRRRSPESAA